MAEPPNKKIPESAAQEKSVEHPVFLFMEVDALGRATTKHANPSKPNDSFTSKVNHDGSFETEEISDSFGGMVTSHKHHERHNAGSSSKNNDGPVDESAQGTKNSNVMGDSGSAAGGTSYVGSTKEIGGSEEGTFKTVPGGKSYTTTTGDIVEKFVGSHHTNIEGDVVRSITGQNFEMVKGDFGLFAQDGGGIDMQSDSGRIRMSAEAQDILIEAKTKITLKVGGSTIVIEPSVITITSAKIDLNP